MCAWMGLVRGTPYESCIASRGRWSFQGLGEEIVAYATGTVWDVLSQTAQAAEHNAMVALPILCCVYWNAFQRLHARREVVPE